MHALVALLALKAEDETEALLSKRTLTCRDWALAANATIALGEARAVARLKTPARNDPFTPLSTRKGILCRILFVPKAGAALRPPGYGGLAMLPEMPLSRWPEYPFVRQDGVWFLLNEAYILAGEPEPTAAYVDYCQKNGTFRKTPLAVPTSAQARRAFDRLQSSPRWKAVRWSDKGLGVAGGGFRRFVLKPIEDQTKF